MFKNLIQFFRNIFYRPRHVAPEKISYWSRKRLSEGVFKFFTPHYIPNGVCLELSDRKGLSNYLTQENKNLETKIQQNTEQESSQSPLDRYCWFKSLESKETESTIKYILDGFRVIDNYLSKLTKDVLARYEEIKIDFSSRYKRQNICSEKSQLNFKFAI